MEVIVSDLTFSSNFDSGNLARVESTTPTKQGKLPNSQVPDLEFNLWTKEDAAYTEYKNSFRSWFFFSVKGSKQPYLTRFNILNLNKKSKLFKNNLYPVFKVAGNPRWRRTREKPVFTDVEEDTVLSFMHRINSQEKVFFALCYPYPYKDVLSYLNKVDAAYSSVYKLNFRGDDVYYHRECLCHSLEGRWIDLITITSPWGISREREPRLKNLFPEVDVPRPFAFPNKKIIFITARVHPAETSSSFVLDGIISSLINKDDPGAASLRKKYLFKIIPVLNPDGVVRGHYRTDSRGVNLNRVYQNPSKELYPSIYATCCMIRYYHQMHERIEGATYDKIPEDSPLLVDGQSPNPEKERKFSKKKDMKAGKDKYSRLYLYLDLHSHASRKGSFLYGNNFTTIEDCVDTRVFAKLMQLNCKGFTYDSCNFSESSMHLKDKSGNGSRDGTGRVWVMSETGINYAYTFEAHYNTGQPETCIPRKEGELESKHWISFIPAEFSAPTYEGVGRAILQSILDLSGANTWSRLYSSSMKSLMKIRDSLHKELSNKAVYQKNVPKTPFARAVGDSTCKSSSQALLQTGVRRKRPETRSEDDITKSVGVREMKQNLNAGEDTDKELNLKMLQESNLNRSPKVNEAILVKSEEYVVEHTPCAIDRMSQIMNEFEEKISSALDNLEFLEPLEEIIHREGTDRCYPL